MLTPITTLNATVMINTSKVTKITIETWSIIFFYQNGKNEIFTVLEIDNTTIHKITDVEYHKVLNNLLKLNFL